jgi:hypothetical protein
MSGSKEDIVMAGEVFYTTKEERDTLCAAAHARGERLLHDDFNIGPDGEHRLTFEVQKPDPLPTPAELRLQELRGKIGDTGKSPTLPEVVEYLRLERGL